MYLAEKQGMNIAVTPGNESWFTWARDLFINVPNLENKANTTAEGVYDIIWFCLSDYKCHTV